MCYRCVWTEHQVKKYLHKHIKPQLHTLIHIQSALCIHGFCFGYSTNCRSKILDKLNIVADLYYVVKAMMVASKYLQTVFFLLFLKQ